MNTPEPMSRATIEAAGLVARLLLEAALTVAAFAALLAFLITVTALCAVPAGV